MKKQTRQLFAVATAVLLVAAINAPRKTANVKTVNATLNYNSDNEVVSYSVPSGYVLDGVRGIKVEYKDNKVISDEAYLMVDNNFEYKLTEIKQLKKKR